MADRHITLFNFVQTGCFHFVSKIAGINLEEFDLDEEALVLVLGGSTLIIPEKWREKLRTSRRPLKGERVYM